MAGAASTFARIVTATVMGGVLSLTLVTSATAAPGGGKDNKTFVCHATGNPGNPWTMLHVSNAAVKAHTRHGDHVVAGPTAVCGSDVVMTDVDQ